VDSNNATDSSDSFARTWKIRAVNKTVSETRKMLIRLRRVIEALPRFTSFLDRFFGRFIDLLNVVVLTLLSHALGIIATNSQVQVWFRSRRFVLLPPVLSCVPNILSPRGPPSTFVS